MIEGRDSVGCNVIAYRWAFRSLVSQIQTELNRLGCDAGTVDGIWGTKSKTALSQFIKASGTAHISTEPSLAMLVQLKRSSGRVCHPSRSTRKQRIPEKASTKKIRDGYKCTKRGAQTYWLDYRQYGVDELIKLGYSCENMQGKPH